MTDDPTPHSARIDPRMPPTPDAPAARLFASLQARPGHAMVVGEDPIAAEALFERVDAQLVCRRRVRLSGRRLDVDAMIQALGADLRGPHRPRSAEAILSMVATEARAAGLPIVVVVTAAEEAGAAVLQRLATLIESVPDARAAVRLVLLGGPLLEDVLAHPDAEPLSARISTRVRAPSRGGGRWVFPLPMPHLDASWRHTAQWVVAALIATLGVFLIVSPWVGRDASVPIAVRSAEKATPEAAISEDAAEPEEAAMTEVPVGEERAAAEPAPESAAAPEPPGAEAVVAPEAVAELPVAEPPAAAGPVAGEAAQRSAERVVRRGPSLGQSLQVGAFRSATNARALAAQLSARFPDVHVVTITREGAPFYCVRLGGFADASALATRADQLRAAGYTPIRAPE